MTCVVQLPQQWVNAAKLEAAFRACGGPHQATAYVVKINFPTGCKVMVDAAVRLLSLANQLIASTRQVEMIFEQGEEGTMGYLNRIGFFDHLDPAVVIRPERPRYSGARRHAGRNVNLVEIARIAKDQRDPDLPIRLTDAVSAACSGRGDLPELSGAAFLIFSELIDNVFSHSSTQLDGYAALQVYSNGHRLLVAVSDSGKGIMDTLRPALATEFPRLVQLSDIDLLVEIFREGISRHGPDRGCGLKGCAGKAIKFNAELDVRLPNQRILLVPAKGAYQPNIAHCYEDLPLLWGTHISFALSLEA